MSYTISLASLVHTKYQHRASFAHWFNNPIGSWMKMSQLLSSWLNKSHPNSDYGWLWIVTNKRLLVIGNSSKALLNLPQNWKNVSLCAKIFPHKNCYLKIWWFRFDLKTLSRCPQVWEAWDNFNLKRLFNLEWGFFQH